ncbi:hypothetical protein CTEN210_11670 [Chaetoceros tenuissimus]|uniref:Transmembrane protein 222 n=1 Tax=Chaetoceros tenuissimus TaxID=426638 RepID=A0AAD3D051_9STRA|nr:hypothetical protein CTEN210_11670 [Chaetoceros tenuissimus]
MSSHRTSINTSTAQQDLSFCILWSPLPPITWLIPFIGHMGIADSNGIASDFQGSYYVGDRGRMAFGPPTRALQIHISEINGGAEHWDRMIMEANQIYNTRVHNLCCDNCHSHVACALNHVKYVRFPWSRLGTDWNMVKLCFLVFFRARFLSWNGFVSQFAPFCILVAITLLMKFLTS